MVTNLQLTLLLMVQLLIPAYGQHPQDPLYKYTFTVSTTKELYTALDEANRVGRTQILIAPGTYQLNKTINIKAQYIALISSSGDPSDTVLRGPGMVPSQRVFNLIRVAASHFLFSGLTAEAVPNHIIQIVGEQDVDYVRIEHCILQNAYEQILKVSHHPQRTDAADHGIVRDCTFGYTGGIGPQYYIGGIDLHLGTHWLIESNQFFGIASPSKHVAEHAIHLWNRSSNNTVIDNIIINSDRGIGFGLSQRGNTGGEIRGNIIFHSDNNHPYADAGIILETSPNTLVEDNVVIQHHSYPNAIEYRFAQTKQVIIRRNSVNQRIRQRNSASALQQNNRRVDDLPQVLKSIIVERFPASYQASVSEALEL